MADSKDKPSGGNREEASTADGSTMMKILDEKDKLIVSLKESSTKRDKLNETQIRLLSEDLHQKDNLVKDLKQKVRDTEFDAVRKESELAIYKITNDKISERLNALKNEISAYKDSIAQELSNLKDVIQKEIADKDAVAKSISEDTKTTISKLESKVKEVEDYYNGILKNLSAKQTAAKKLVREAIDTLQDSLNYLDMGNLDLYKPSHIDQEFQQVVDSSRKSISEKEDILRAGRGGDTIIRNIENVHVRLSQSPQLESVFSDISGLSASARKELQAIQRRTGGGDGAGSGSGGGGTGGGTGGGSAGTGGGGSQTGMGGVAGQTGGASRGGQAGGGNEAGEGSGDEGGNQAGGEEPEPFAGNNRPRNTAQPEERDNDPNKLLKKRSNFAPFDWQKILNDMQLRKYTDLIKVCNKAIREGNYVKAINLFRTIREQPGIQETEVTTKMIDEEIEFLEKTVKDKYTRKPEG